VDVYDMVLLSRAIFSLRCQPTERLEADQCLIAKPSGGWLMRAEQCRRNAEHCLSSARRMSNAESRDALTDMARYWTALAEWAETERQQQNSVGSATS